MTTLAFDVSNLIAPDGWLGNLLKGIFNFSPATTVLQAAAWVLYVTVVLTLFLRPVRTPSLAASPSPATQSTQPTVSA